MEAISVPGPSRARLPFVASKRLGLNQRVIGSSRSERQGRTLSHAFRGQQGFNDRSQEFSGNIESIGCLRRAKRIGKKRLFANEIVCECVAIGAFEDEASGRRHEPKSERAREVRKSALMAVSLGPRRHGGNRDQGFGHRYAVEMIPNEILYRGRDHFAGPQDLKHIWEERGKADRDSPGSWDGVGGLNRGENAEAVAATGTSSTSMANTRRINWDQE